MKEDELIKQLEKVDLSGIALPNHERHLRKALLGSGRFKESTTMKILKIGSPIGGAVVLGGIIAAVLLSSGGTTGASPQQVVAKSSRAVAALTPAEKTALTEQLRGSGGSGQTKLLVNGFALELDDLLTQAENAKDLTVLTSEQFKSQYGSMVPIPLDGRQDDMTWLKFTGSEGVGYLLTINKQSGLPVGIFVFQPASNANGKTASVMIVAPSANRDPGVKEVLVVPSSNGTGTVTINGKQVSLPSDTDTNNVQVHYKDGKIFVNGQEIQQ